MYSVPYCGTLENFREFAKNRQKPVAKIISHNFFECLKIFIWIKLVPLLRSADLSADPRLGHVVGLHEISIISELMILTRWFKNDLLADEKNDQKNHKTDNLSDIYCSLKMNQIHNSDKEL